MDFCQEDTAIILQTLTQKVNTKNVQLHKKHIHLQKKI